MDIWDDRTPFVAQQNYDVSWHSMMWREYLERAGRSLDTPPIYVRLSIRPPSGKPEERQQHLARRQQLLAILPRYPFIVVLEDRPAASLFAAAITATGNLIKGGSVISHGTLGGIMVDTNSGDHFAMTCGHVVQGGQTLNFTDTNGNISSVTGVCAAPHHFPPAVNPPGIMCNPGITNCVVNHRDIAFLRLSGKIMSTEVNKIGRITGVSQKTDLTPKQTIQMYGQATRYHQFEIGGLTVSYELGLNGDIYCFENLFEVRGVPVRNLAASLQRALLNVPEPGDSGAWICVPTKANCADFAGMLIGGDLLMGYAMFTDTVTDTAQNANLNLVPI
jgi:hypothetical protein